MDKSEMDFKRCTSVGYVRKNGRNWERNVTSKIVAKLSTGE
jgi:hypothetical protein